MTLAALIVYGSHARGEAERDSDVDLLGLDLSEVTAKKSHVNRVNLTVYNPHYLVDQAKLGDLFLLHIVREAKPLFDPEGWFATLQKAYSPRSDYSDEIAKASQLGTYIAQFNHRFRNSENLAQRLAWIVRTILIARSHQSGAAVFSRDELVRRFPHPFVSRALSSKSVTRASLDVASLSDFLEKYGAAIPDYPESPDLSLVQRYLIASGNTYAAKAIRELESLGVSDDTYPAV